MLFPRSKHWALCILCVIPFILSAQLPAFRSFPSEAYIDQIKQAGHTLYVNERNLILTKDLLSGQLRWFYPEHNNMPTYSLDILGADAQGGIYYTKDTTLYVYRNSQWQSFALPAGASLVTDIEAVDSANVWICVLSPAYGLLKFDGQSFTVYSTSNSGLPCNSVYDCAFDSSGTLWLGTSCGLVAYDMSNWVVYNTSNSSIPSNVIPNVYIDAAQDKWMGAGSNSWGCVKFDGSAWTLYTTSNSQLVDNRVNDVAVDSAGVVYFGTNMGLSVLNNSTWTTYVTPFRYLTNRYVKDLLLYDSTLYTGSVNGLASYDGTSFKPETGTFTVYSSFRIDSLGQKILTDWVHKSVTVFDGVSVASCSVYDSTATQFDSIAHDFDPKIDLNGKKWWPEIIVGPNVQFSSGGVRMRDGVTDTVYNTSNSPLPNNTVYDILVDSLNTKWFATGGGVASFDGTSWAIYNTSNSGLTSNQVLQLRLSTDGTTIWATTATGLSRFVAGTWNTYTPSNSPMPANFGYSSIEIDHNNSVWVGLYAGGLVKIDSSFNWTLYDTINSGLTDATVYDLEFDRFNKLWMATQYGGICGFDGYNWETPSFPFSVNGQKHFYIDRYNNKWFAQGDRCVVFNEHGVINSSLYPVTGTVFVDLNQNGTRDSADFGLAGEKVLLLPDSITCITNADGDYFFNYTGGIKTVLLVGDTNWVLTSDSVSFLVDSIADISNHFDFGLFRADTVVATDMELISSGLTRCNHQVTQWMMVRNTGNVTINGAPLLTLQQGLGFQALSPLPAVVNAQSDSIAWRYSGLLPSHQAAFHFNVGVPGFPFIGDTLTERTLSYAAMAPDTNYILVGKDSLMNRVICAYDPNAKYSLPAGDTSIYRYTPVTDHFTYTINFQNTGSDTAFNVIIKDTIDPLLDLVSFELLASSHNVSTTIDPATRCISFLFYNIMLPDSGASEPFSHGFVRYRIHTLPGLPDSSVVRNTAHILFDLNSPVVTNQALNTLVDDPAVVLEQNRPAESFEVWPSVLTNASGTVHFSNPGNLKYEIRIYDGTGKTVGEATTRGDSFYLGLPTTGIFYLQFYAPETGEIHSQKIVFCRQ